MQNNINYKKFELPLYTDKDKIKSWLDKFEIKNYYINDNNIVDIDGDILLDQKDVHQFRIQFGRVSGNFNASLCKLKTLLGSPIHVSGDFIVSRNSIESLMYSPESIMGKFYCNGNKLKSLINGPKKVGGMYGCFNNNLENLVGAPEICLGIIASNNRMKSLKGSPRKIETTFFLNNNLLSNLEGGPEYVGEEYDVSGNNLNSLKGIAKYIGFTLNISSNKIECIDDSFDNDLEKPIPIYGNAISENIGNVLLINSNEFKRFYAMYTLELNLKQNNNSKKMKI